MRDAGIERGEMRLMGRSQLAEIAIAHFLMISDNASFQNPGRWKPVDELIAVAQILDEIGKERLGIFKRGRDRLIRHRDSDKA